DGKTAPAALLGRARAAIRLHPPAWEQARKDADEASAAASLSDADRLYASAIEVLARNAAGTGDILTRLKDLPRPDRFPLESSEEKSQVKTARKELLKRAQEELETAELSRARLIADALKQDDPKAMIYADVTAAQGSDDAGKIKNLLIASSKPPRFAGLCA